MTKKQEKLALLLYEIGAIKLGSFKLKLHDKKPKAPLSPVYIDLRILRRFPKAKKQAVEVYEELIKKLKFNLLADVPTSATPLVSSLADKLKVGMITTRADNKKHGTGAKIDGLQPEDKGKTALMIDDLVTGADSKIEAGRVLKAAGVKVKDVVVLVDRQQGGRKQLTKSGYRLHTALTLDPMLKLYLKKGKLKKEQFKDIKIRLEELSKFLAH